MQQYLSFIDGKPVLTTGNHFHLCLHFPSCPILSFPPPIADSPLAKALKSPVSIFAATAPEKFTSLSEITSLSLASSNLVTLPESLCNPHSPPPFYYFVNCDSLNPFLSFTVSLTNLVDLDLHGNDNLDFGALSRWFNQSSIIFLDLSWIPQWHDDPGKLALLMKSAKKLKHLRYSFLLAVSLHLMFVSYFSQW